MIDIETTPKTTSRRQVEDAFVVTTGATANQLAKIFDMNYKNIIDILTANDVPIVGQKNGGPIYRIRDAAPHLVPKVAPDEMWFAAMKKTGIPPALRKEFWQAASARQAYEEDNGDLWRTSAVQQLVGEIFKGVNLAVRMVADNVQRDAGLSPQQRQRVINHMDMLLIEMKNTIEERFSSIDLVQQRASLND